MPLVSIIMPVYNAESTLNRAIESVLNQTNGDWELICVDDGSEDNSYKILETYSQNDRRIKSYHKNNSGPGLTRNFAFLKATGEYFAFLDSDDWYENDFVELVNEKVKSDNPDLIFYDLVCEKTNGEKIRSVQISKSKNISKKDLLKFQMTGKIEWGMVKVIKKKNNN